MSVPRWAQALLRRVAGEDAEALLGDLEEGDRRRRRSHGALLSGAGTVLEALELAVAAVRARRPDGTEPGPRWTDLGSDGRYAVRTLLRSPGFAVVAVLSLSLGIGATSAVFGTILRMLHDPLPVDRPEELVVVYWRRDVEADYTTFGSSQYRDPVSGQSYNSSFSSAQAEALLAVPGLDGFAFSFARGLAVATGDGPPVLAGGLLADGRYTTVLRPGIALGRGLTEGDAEPGAPAVALLGHGFWMRAFGGDPGAVGSTVRVNGVSVEIVGVTAAGYEGLSRGSFFPRTDITLPLMLQARVLPRWGESLKDAPDVGWLRVMGRVTDPARRGDVQRRLTAAFASVPAPVMEPAGEPPSVVMAPGSRGPEPAPPETGRMLWILLGVVGAVLVITCVNLASLMSARGAAREHEIAVRRALGGGRAALRPLWIEALVLSVTGTAGGLLLLVLLEDALTRVLSTGLGNFAFGSIEVAPRLGWSIVVFGAVVGCGVTLLFGLLPALRLSSIRGRLASRVVGRRTRGPGSLLVALQIAISVPLLAGAGLLLRTITNLDAVDVGFDPTDLMLVQVDPQFTDLSPDHYADLYTTLLQRITALPGVRSATLIENVFMSGLSSSRPITVEDERHSMLMNAVGPDFESTMGMRLVAGRMPDANDRPGRPAVAAVNEAAVREIFDGRSPVGELVRMGDEEVQIVGVVSDARYTGQRAPVRPVLYDSALQRRGYGGHNLVIRAPGMPAGLAAEVRRVIAEVNPDLPVPTIDTQRDRMDRTVARERVFSRVLAGFGVFALLLAGIGVHGVTAFWVARRIPELGVRMALGARSSGILGLVLRRVALLAGIGVVIGIPAALAGTRVMRSLLFGVTPGDPLSLALGALALLAAAILAGAGPALRAARLDPLTALRRD